MADAVNPDVAPVDAATLVQAHSDPPFFWRFRIQSMTCPRKKTNLPAGPVRRCGKPRGTYFCRTVQTEQPRSNAILVMSSGSPRNSEELQSGIRCVDVRSIATQFSSGPRENRQQTEGLKAVSIFQSAQERGPRITS